MPASRTSPCSPRGCRREPGAAPPADSTRRPHTMGMGGGGSRQGPKSEINVTPLVDVVLVLLIIFMVVTPLLQMGYDVETPPKVEGLVTPPTQEDQLIVRMDAGGHVFLNQEEVPYPQFAVRLGQALKGRENKLAFFAADGDL